MMKVAIIGRTQLLYETAMALRDDGHEIGCIVTARAAPEYTKSEAHFEELAQEFSAPFFLATTLSRPETEEACRGLDVGVSVNWISVVRQRQIDLFRLGILNAHLGDLPKYRGNACPNWAILRGEPRVVHSIHFMEGGELDCGRIVEQAEHDLDDTTTITDIYKWAEEITPRLFVRALRRLERDGESELKFADLHSPEAFRCYPRLPEDGFIDWRRSARDIHNLIRAVCDPFPGAYAYHRLDGKVKKLIVLKSRVHATESSDVAVPGHVLRNDPDSGESLVQCGEGVVALAECRYEGEQHSFAPGKRWKSIRMRLSVRVEDWLWECSEGGPRRQNAQHGDLGLP